MCRARIYDLIDIDNKVASMICHELIEENYFSENFILDFNEYKDVEEMWSFFKL